MAILSFRFLKMNLLSHALLLLDLYVAGTFSAESRADR